MKKLVIRTGLWIYNCWNLVMDDRHNPLKYIPDPSLRMYFTLILFTMWSFYFGIFAANYMGWLGYNSIVSLIVHIAVLIPLMFTWATFEDAKRDGHKWYSKAVYEEEKRQFWKNRPSRKNQANIIKWDIDKEA